MAESPVAFDGADKVSPADNLFGRVILRNKLASKKDLERCVADLVAERAELGSKRSLADILVDEGILEAKAAEQVRAAIEKKVSQRQSELAPPGSSGVIESPAQKPKSQAERQALRAEQRAKQEKEMTKLIKLAIRGRHHQEVLIHIIQRKLDVLNPKSMAAALKLTPADVVKVLNEWKARGIVKSRGAYPYAFEPGEDDLRSMHLFVRLWRDRSWHTKLLGMILQQE